MLVSALEQLLSDTTGPSLRLFAPEAALVIAIVLMLLSRIIGGGRLPASWIALWGALIAFGFSWLQYRTFSASGGGTIEYFTGLMVFDQFAALLRLLLLLFTILVIGLTSLTGIPDDEDGADFFSLLLGSVIGMLLMVGANHLLMVFLAVEMAGVPGYALSGFLKGRRQSSEAALKFVVYGAGAAGILLYGISLIGGLTGTLMLPELAARLRDLFGETGAGMGDPAARTLLLAVVMVVAGLAFKLSVAPFHFWCPDVFEGSAAEVGGFLSVASKAAAFALLLRFVHALATPVVPGMGNFYLTLGLGLAVLASLTATLGNLAAYRQRNLKRMLAYSTIAQAGYMLMAVAAAMTFVAAASDGAVSVADAGPRAARAIEGLTYYLVIYLFMNLGPFAMAALIRNEIFSEEIDDLRGAGRQSPLLAVCMGLCLFSLVGMPPLGGFFAKLAVFASLVDAAALHSAFWIVLGLACVNTVISLWYYVNVLRVMTFYPRPADAPEVNLGVSSWPGLYLLVICLPVLALGILIQPVSEAAAAAARSLFP